MSPTVWFRRWQDRHPNVVPITGTLFGFAFIVIGMWGWTQNMARDAQTERDLAACRSVQQAAP